MSIERDETTNPPLPRNQTAVVSEHPRWDRQRLQLGRLASSGRQRRLRRDETVGDAAVDFRSNDYLGLAQKPLRPGRHSLSELSIGAAASPLVSGWTEPHQSLMDAIVDFEVAESGLVFSSGYAACMGTIAGLAEADDLILSDQLNHASLIDGCRLSPATVEIYRHADVESLTAILHRVRSRFDQCWIVTDSVFSMDGTTAPLVSLCDVADRFDATLVVDEAHATGVLGPNGRGLAHHHGVHRRIPVRIGTLSKAMGMQGGFVVGPQVLMDRLINHCRPFIYSTALSPMIASQAADLIREMQCHDIAEPRRNDLFARTRWLREAFADEADRWKRHGLSVPNGEAPPMTPIVPLIVGADQTALQWATHFERHGIQTVAIRPPTVPERSARIRISVSALHGENDLRRLIAAINAWPDQTKRPS